jgi:hypothetical protein
MAFTCIKCKCKTELRIKYKWVEKLLNKICLECLNKSKHSEQKKKFLIDLDNKEFDYHWISSN